ncbi:hypothetical protein VP01_3968g1 [Puccinia sorghi]|uniref:Uncharacterized protein n=1 Tax=Puccinia sorghi TaxID=27349 RepID=A0A0L6US97_9BASI|nr:hypothetical protein VP01_3968g1 [Puccinia sorghi]
MMELMEETSGSALQAVQPLGGLRWVEQVTQEEKSKGKETEGSRVPVPGKKKAAELAKRALSGESQVALSLKELATILLMMAEELILVIWESAGLKADRNHISFYMRSGEASEVILGRPFLFAFRAGIRYDLAQREVILSVMDSRGVRFETNICQPASWNWEESGRAQVGKEEERRGEKGEAHPFKSVAGGKRLVEGGDE